MGNNCLKGKTTANSNPTPIHRNYNPFSLDPAPFLLDLKTRATFVLTHKLETLAYLLAICVAGAYLGITVALFKFLFV